VADLTDRGYVDDQAFARWWAEARARGRRVGQAARAPARLADYLLRRGYPAATVRHAVRVLLAERGADLSGIEEDGSV